MLMRSFFIWVVALSIASSAVAETIVPGRVLVRWRDAGVASRRIASTSWKLGRALQPETHLILTTATEQATRELIDQLRADPDVVYAEPDRVRQRFADEVVPNDPRYSEQWALPLIKAPLGWSRTTGSGRVTVAIVDTGLVPHPELTPRVVGGYDFITDPANAGDGDGRDSDYTDNGDATEASSELHGTHVAGIVGAVANNGIGVAGLDWNCKLVIARVLGVNHGTGVDSDIADAMRWAAGIHVDGVPDNPNPANIINMSFGGDGTSMTMQGAVTDVVAKGVVVVAAAGNSTTDAANTVPAALTGVIAIGAVDETGQIAPYSNYGPTVALMAPGGNPDRDPMTGNPLGVLSTIELPTNDFTYTWLAGTSQATPFVSGTLSMMKGLYPHMTPDEARQLLQKSANPSAQCRSQSTPSQSGCGAGLLDVDAALVLASAANSGGNGMMGTVIVGGCAVGGSGGGDGFVLVAALLLVMWCVRRRRAI
jgi:serine protease